MEYIKHLSKDKHLKKLIPSAGIEQLKQEKNICLYLCYSIMSQQLSTKVATVFHKRFDALFGKGGPTAEKIMQTPFEMLRSIGLSNAKARYILNVAEFELTHGMSLRKLNKMSDDEVISYLTQIKGVGKWTVEMLLMFALGRADVFSADDLGIQQSMINLYALPAGNKKQLKQDMHAIAARWSPYRTYACLLLWRSRDLK